MGGETKKREKMYGGRKQLGYDMFGFADDLVIVNSDLFGIDKWIHISLKKIPIVRPILDLSVLLVYIICIYSTIFKTK
jgi:hypothetical protein